MIIGKIFLLLLGASYGLLSAAGVFTVLAAVGLVPRFEGKTHTAKKAYLYEEMVIWGTIVGCLASVFPEFCWPGLFFQTKYPESFQMWQRIGQVLLVIIGLFGGMFIGSLALAIAEMLDSIPIFARRVAFRRGLRAAIFSMALGKLAGSLFYFAKAFYMAAG